MNKAITDGLQLMPPAFSNGLNVWARGDGLVGSDTYDVIPTASYVSADANFGGCLELQKTEAVQKIRYMGQTPIQPGCYLEVRARIKAVSGNLPSVRIAGWAGGTGGAHVGGVIETGPLTTLTSYGHVTELRAIVGTGHRSGVDMAWGGAAQFGHFGIDLTGPSGGIVRVDDIQIIDVTEVFLRNMLSVVDVRDYGARGDGTTDDSAAFEAADVAADGRRVLVPAGTYHLGQSVSFSSNVIFEGTVTMPDDKMLLLTKNYGLPAYIDAFDNEELAFRKAFQALLNNTDHDSLDMGGRKISLSGPIDMQAAVPNKTSYATRRVIRNGQIEAASGAGWDTSVMTSVATYNPDHNTRKLTNVANVANIPVGALVSGNGVGREIYVRSKNVSTQEITLNAPLFDAAGTQTFTFTDFRYMIDFVGFSSLSKLAMNEIEFQCNGRASGIRLAPSGRVFHLRDCVINKPRDRGLTSIGSGCQGLLVDRCQFLSAEDSVPVSSRVSVGLNTNANDAKIRNNRATRLRHFALLGGSNNVVIGNHFFQGDETADGIRTAGLILAKSHTSSVINGNYVDNCYIDWTNERDPYPEFNNEFSFSSLTISDNVFLSGDVADWFAYIVVRPHGTGHYLNGLNVTGNRFRSISGAIDRVDRVDTSFANLNYARMKDVTFAGNSFHNIRTLVANPLRVHHAQAVPSGAWTVSTNGQLPFRGRARLVESVVVEGPLLNGAGAAVHRFPYTNIGQGANQDQIRLTWGESVRGNVITHIRMDR